MFHIWSQWMCDDITYKMELSSEYLNINIKS